MRRHNKRGGVDKGRGGSSLPLSILLSRTLVRADPSLGFYSPQRVMTMDRSLAVGNGAVIGAGTVLEISFWHSLDLLITEWTLSDFHCGTCFFPGLGKGRNCSKHRERHAGDSMATVPFRAVKQGGWQGSLCWITKQKYLDKTESLP